MYRTFNMGLTEKNKAIWVVGFVNKKRLPERGQQDSGQQPH